METFDKDSLCGAAADIDAAAYLIQTICEDFITKYHPDNAKDHFAIAWEWNRCRGYIRALEELIYSVGKAFKDADITPYSEPVSTPEK